MKSFDMKSTEEKADIYLKKENFEDFQKSEKLTDVQLAAKTTISYSQICRVKKDLNPGKTFIAKMLNAFPDKSFDDFFTIQQPQK